MNSIEDVIDFLCEHRLMLTTAESCTAGMVTSLLADVPGCGSVLDTGFVVYTEHAKNHCLDVNLQTIKTFGLTSEEVAREMAVGALKRSQSNFSVAITGTAESNDELNGVVCFAYALGDDTNKILSETIKFDGERNHVRYLAAMHAIRSIPEYYQRFLSGDGDCIE
ncbi:competence damage-inducible protein A [Cellvibrio zantedeschiae]|uniref:Competence damage-inducible protein A n=1 Tax=Cellvibrio zantedeschiae TaxID=1237077 RepID=A0ABQ3B543_9GAMM|nr:CinA family protein [Cellvibrio zantedeschiae]GGY78920.1 competence damage-inducible protein A [Cellvibrio zantedeschiae]